MAFIKCSGRGIGMRIARRLFVVPIANDKHGKSTMIRALVSQGLGRTVGLQKKGVRELTSPWGRVIDAFVFGRSYQEKEKREHGSVEQTLDANDPRWKTRELIIMPSHVDPVKDESDIDADIDEIISAAHGAGFDAICASVIFTGAREEDRSSFTDIWRKPWDERWTIPNPYVDQPEGQLEALGRDLWTWICRALAS
jgi:hypothetical protein